jgi:hypothetical protein
MTYLRDEMYDTYASLHVDLDRLATQAQLEGGRLRRRNRGLAAAWSTLAVLVAVGLGAWATNNLAAGVPTVREGSPAGGPSAATLLTGVDVLTATLARVAPRGVVSHASEMNYETGREGSPNALGDVTFAPSAGAAPATVLVNYWPAETGDVELHSQCHDSLVDCTASRLPDGSVVLSYAVEGSDLPWVGGSSSGLAAHRVVDGTVVTIAASAPREVGSGASGQSAVLTRDQLVDLISQPEWHRLLPVPPSD